MPADRGVAGRGGSGDFNSGSGRDEVLSRASTASRSIRFGSRLASLIGETVEPEEEVGREGGRLDFRSGSWGTLNSGDPLGSGALITRPVSLSARRGLLLEADTVLARVILGSSGDSVNAVSSTGCGLRAWATAIGPAAPAKPGTPMLARTKLASMVTGSVFSLIFSWRAASPRPKTMFWTLLKTRRHVLKDSDWEFEERS